MNIIQSPNKYIPNDNFDKIFIYLSGTIISNSNWQKDLIDYIKNNIQKYSIEKPDKIVLFNPRKENVNNNSSEEEIKEQIKWENENIRKSDIFTIFLDEVELSNDNKVFYELGRYLKLFQEIYNDNINDHFLICYKKGYKQSTYLKEIISSDTKDILKPIEINEMSEYGELILKKIENLYKKTNQFTKKNVIEDVNTHCHYWSESLNPMVKKVFCQSPWPKSQFKIGILGKYGIGKTALFRWFYEGRYCRVYEYTIGGAFTLYQVEINNKNFIIGFDDTGGQEKFGADCCRSFIKNNNYAILVFDITERKSFDEIKKRYYPFIQGSENLKNNCVLVGNKLDLNYERKVSYEEAEFFADEKKMKYFEVSVKSGLNMQRLFNYIHYYLSKNIA